MSPPPPKALPHQIHHLFEDNHTLAVFKPAGMLSVPAKNQEPSLEEILQAHLDNNIQAVHRIDKVTEGILLFAKTQFGNSALLNAFQRRLVDKRYLVVAEGCVPFKKTTVEESLQKTQLVYKGQKHFVQNIDADGQKASTHFRVWASNEKASLLEARPFTGRMHQIRAHLSHLGFPIAGDLLYGAKHPYSKGNIALCAAALNFPPPKGKRVSVVATPSKAFTRVCEKLELPWDDVITHLKNEL